MNNIDRLACSLEIRAGAKLQSAPVKKEMIGKWYSHIIEIDKDHTAELLIDEDSLRALHKIRANCNKESKTLRDKIIHALTVANSRNYDGGIEWVIERINAGWFRGE